MITLAFCDGHTLVKRLGSETARVINGLTLRVPARYGL